MDFKNKVIDIQTADYNGARIVLTQSWSVFKKWQIGFLMKINI